MHTADSRPFSTLPFSIFPFPFATFTFSHPATVHFHSPVPSSSGLQSVVLSFAWQDLCSGVLGLIKSLYGSQTLTQVDTLAQTQIQIQIQMQTHMREISLFMFEVYSTFLPLSLSISISIFVAVHFVCKMILLLLATTFGMQNHL